MHKVHLYVHELLLSHWLYSFMVCHTWVFENDHYVVMMNCWFKTKCILKYACILILLHKLCAIMKIIISITICISITQERLILSKCLIANQEETFLHNSSKTFSQNSSFCFRSQILWQHTTSAGQVSSQQTHACKFLSSIVLVFMQVVK